jgi:hypothetical protein
VNTSPAVRSGAHKQSDRTRRCDSGRSDGTAFDIELSGHQRFGKLRFHDEAKQWIQPTVPRCFRCRVAIDGA